MPDITIRFNAQLLSGDFILTPTDLLTGDDLKTSIIVSPFTELDWWANTFEPDAWGSRVLTLRRAKHTNDTLLRARDYCRTALRWLIDDRVAQSVDVVTGWLNDMLCIGITVTQASGVTRYSFEWEGI